MKLRHQIAILLGFPMVCQLASTMLLTLSLASIDETARKEAKAKEVVGLCHECGALIGQAIMQISAPTVVSTQKRSRSKLVLAKLGNRIRELHRLVKNNSRASEAVDSLERDSKRLLVTIDEFSHAFNFKEGTFIFSQYFEFSDYVESLKVQLDQAEKDGESLLDIYGPAAKEFQPAAIKARSELRNWTIAAITLNVLLVLALAIAVNRKTLIRLLILMKNMQAFSRGEQSFQSLDGSDELAELNLAFKSMAAERYRLEEIRKSLLAMVSHDIKSPLASLSLDMELILDIHKPSLPGKANKILERMYSVIQRLSRLASTLLDVEKIEGGNLEVSMDEHSCADILGAAIAAIASLAEKKQLEIKIEYKNDEESLIYCDKDRTIQVLVNLLSNAIKFAPDKSTITIRVQTSVEGLVKLEIIDEGPGVPADKVNSLFEKFHQLDQPSEVKMQGSGLGLYICKKLIAAQSGKIGYASSETGSGGACFWFELPKLPIAQDPISGAGAKY